MIAYEPYDSLEVTNVKNTEANVLNEMIGLFSIQHNEVKEDCRLKLSDWNGIDQPLDASIFEAFISKFSSLTELTVSHMDALNPQNRWIIAKQVVTLIHESSTLKKIDLEAFSGENDTGEGKVILSALRDSACLPELQSFICSKNQSWFTTDN